VSSTITTYHDLELKPYQISLQQLKLVKKINEHSKAFFTGIVSEDRKDKYIEMTEAQTPVEISQRGVGPDDICIFKGIVTNIKVKSVRDIYYIEGEALSHTYLMDIKVKSRSFQNKDLSYRDLINSVIQEYSGADCSDTVTEGETIKKFILQYQETDWQFLKRMASHFHTGLIPDLTSGKPKFYFGLPESATSKKIDNFHYSVGKNISNFWYSSENYLRDVSETDFIYYEVESDEILDLGSEVDFKDRCFYVRESSALMQDGILKHHYILAPKIGLSHNNIYNYKIVGASVMGKVIDISNDNVRVHLEIDEKQNKDEAYWFPYSSIYTAEGNSGWYCMPEIGDYVRVYFPDKQEENGIALNAVRQDKEKTENNKVDNPDIKYFRTKSGKELMFSPEEIVLTGKDNEVFLRINEKYGIEIYSIQPVKITSKEGIEMDCQKKIIMAAQDEINISCKESKISMDGATHINGSKVKIN
jgi:phage baseplate assembly protein gpV